MRIAVSAEQLRRGTSGGIGTYTTQILNGLAAKGESVTAILSRGGRPPALDPRVRTLQAPLPHLIATRLWERNLLRTPSSLAADVLHAASFTFASPGARSVALCSTFVHDLAWQSHPQFFTQRGLRFHERAFARVKQSNGSVLVPSTAVADSILRTGSVHKDRVVVTGEGADHLPDPAGSARSREYILSVGTLEPRKNLATLFRAYAAYRGKTGPGSADLVVVGPAGWNGASQSGVPEVVPEGVVLHGSVSPAELANLYTYARLFVFVPHAEGFGLPAVEAMRFGTPVISAHTVPSVMESDPLDSDAWSAPARLIDPTDERGLAALIGDLATSDSQLAELSEAGRHHVRNRTWENTVKRHIDAWDEHR